MPKKKTEKEYLEKFNEVHNSKYRYEPFPDSFNQHTKVNIICPKHGKFSQTICNHANGMGCPKCGKESMSNKKVNTNIKRSMYIDTIMKNYELEYDFSDTDFNVPYDSKVKVVCKVCKKEQYKRLSDLIRKKAGCTFCRIDKMQKGFYQSLRDIGEKEFLRRASELYGNKYDYSEIEYKGNSIPVKIICPIHGEFFKSPATHIYNLEECPICRAESMYSKFEEMVSRFLDNNKIKYIPQFCIKENNYLKNKPFDFFISNCNLLVEIDGPQHRELCWDMTEEDLLKRQEIDKNKTREAITAGYNIIRISTNTDIIMVLKEELDKYK